MPKKKRPPRVAATPHWILDAARDFHLGSAMLSKHFGGSLFPLRATVVTHVFSIELHLKFLHARASGTVPETHDLRDLFTELAMDVQNDVRAQYRGTRPLLEVLTENRSAFVEWRYIFEKQAGGFSLDFQALRSVLEALVEVSGAAA